MKERLYYFDNIKFWLMMFVIIHHCSMPFLKVMGGDWAKFLYTLIMPFTMSTFTMISGYFYKKKQVCNLISSYLIPCVIFSMVNIAWAKLSPVPFVHNRPVSQFGYAMWYMWVLFIYNIITPSLLKILKLQYLVVLSIGVALVVCQQPWANAKNLQLCRLFSHYPFFLIGLMMSQTGFLEKYRSIRNVRALSGMVFVAVWLFNVILCSKKNSWCFIAAFNSHKPFTRLIYGFALCIVLSVCLLLVVGNRKRWYSKMGARTLAPYLLHMSVVFPVCWIVAVPYLDTWCGVMVCMLGVPSICLLLFSEKVSSVISRLFRVFDLKKDR